MNMCNNSNVKKKALAAFLEKQRKAIDEYKWIESEKAGKDLGPEAVKAWIKKYARRFRREYLEAELQEALEDINELEKEIKDKKLLSIIEKCKEKIEDTLDLI